MIRLRNNKIFTDGFLAIIAQAVPIVMLQFFVLPSISVGISAMDYGVLIASMAWINMIALTLGNVLNNSRLISEKKYKAFGESGDFNLILVVLLSLNVLCVLIVLLNHLELDLFSKATLFITSLLLCLNSYLLVEFRISLNYIRGLVESLILSGGYLVGYFIFRSTGYWTFVYFIGAFCSSIYLIARTKLLNESWTRTRLFSGTAKTVVTLLGSGLLISAGLYLDKIILLPLVGGKGVGAYYVSTLLGKTIGLVLSPLAGLALSYLAQHSTISNQRFSQYLFAGVVVSLLCYGMVIFLANPVLSILYPSFVQDAMPLVPITSATSILLVLGGIMNSFLMNFRAVSLQIYLNGIYVGMYLVFSLLFFRLFGMFGFCFGLFLASIIRLVTIVILFYRTKLTSL